MNFLQKFGVVLYWVTAVGPIINMVVGAVKGVVSEVSRIIDDHKNVLKGGK